MTPANNGSALPGTNGTGGGGGGAYGGVPVSNLGGPGGNGTVL